MVDVNDAVLDKARARIEKSLQVRIPSSPQP